MKKISLLSLSLRRGGAERVITTLLDEFVKKFEVHLFLLERDIEYELNKNVEVHFFSSSFLLKQVKEYIEYCDKLQIDVSISFLTKPNLINVLSKRCRSTIKIVLNERSNPFIAYRSLNKMPVRILLPFIYCNKADLIIANSKKTAEDLKENFKLKNVKVVYNPVDFEKVSMLKKQDIDMSEFKNNFLFITVGRLEKVKRQDILIKAFHIANLRNSKLLIIGEGPLRPRLEKLVTSLNLKGKVIFLGKQNNPFAFLNKANCFVLTSEYEGFPNALLEAMACSLPVISTDCISGPREILSDLNDLNYGTCQKGKFQCVKYGILVNVNDIEALSKAMREIYNNSYLRNYYRKKSVERVQIFNKENIFKCYLRLIEQL